MRGFAYIAFLFAVMACWIVWQVLRRISAGTRAIINPERYAIEKVVEMQRDLASSNVNQSEWQIALHYYPDLMALNGRLSRMSEELSSRFRASLFGTKQFSDRHEIAKRLEEEFLRENFGGNQQIVKFGRELLLSGNKTAAAELRRTVSVLGDNLDHKVVISRIQSRFGDVNDYIANLERSQAKNTLRVIAKRVLSTEYVSDAKALIEAAGGEVRVDRVPGVMFGKQVVALQLGERVLHFEGDYEMAQWVVKEIAPHFIEQYHSPRE